MRELLPCALGDRAALCVRGEVERAEALCDRTAAVGALCERAALDART